MASHSSCILIGYSRFVQKDVLKDNQSFGACKATFNNKIILLLVIVIT